MPKVLTRLVLLALLGVLVPRAEAQYGVPLNCDIAEHNGDCAMYGISLVQLLADPAKYDGKHIRVVGYVHFDSENKAIYLHKEDQEHHLLKNGFWVSPSDGVSFDDCQDSYALIEGVYRARNTGHMSLWSGAITHVTKCQRVP